MPGENENALPQPTPTDFNEGGRAEGAIFLPLVD